MPCLNHYESRLVHGVTDHINAHISKQYDEAMYNLFCQQPASHCASLFRLHSLCPWEDSEGQKVYLFMCIMRKYVGEHDVYT